MALLASLATAACSVIGVRTGTEEPAYTVVGQAGAVEIRHYNARAAAETTVDAGEMAARSEGFQRLAGYIFGRNAGAAKIEMTAPVAQSVTVAMTAPVAQDGPVVRFFLPATLTAATAPRPLDNRVRIVAVLAGSPYQAEGTPFSWFYDPPWTLPPFRRNEAVMRVRLSGGVPE